MTRTEAAEHVARLGRSAQQFEAGVNALRDSFDESSRGLREIAEAIRRIGSILPVKVGRYKGRTSRQSRKARNRRKMARASRRRNRGTR